MSEINGDGEHQASRADIFRSFLKSLLPKGGVASQPQTVEEKSAIEPRLIEGFDRALGEGWAYRSGSGNQLDRIRVGGFYSLEKDKFLFNASSDKPDWSYVGVRFILAGPLMGQIQPYNKEELLPPPLIIDITTGFEGETHAKETFDKKTLESLEQRVTEHNTAEIIHFLESGGDPKRIVYTRFMPPNIEEILETHS